MSGHGMQPGEQGCVEGKRTFHSRGCACILLGIKKPRTFLQVRGFCVYIPLRLGLGVAVDAPIDHVLAGIFYQLGQRDELIPLGRELGDDALDGVVGALV